MLLAANHALGDEPNRKSERLAEGIMDNSFLVEEAYNQEPGVVQHIFNNYLGYDLMGGAEDRANVFAFTQEWPVFSQRHQFSYTVPYSWLDDGERAIHGIGDVLLNYRFQAWLNPDTLSAFAPRASLVLPTGNANRGLGDDTTGMQFNLPYSRSLGNRWYVHANAGLTYLPNSGSEFKTDRLLYNLGASGIFAVSRNFNLMLEWISLWNEIPTSSSHSQYQFTSLISPGFRYAFNLPRDVQIVVGLAAPFGLTRESTDYGAFIYLSIEHYFYRPKTQANADLSSHKDSSQP